MSVNTKEVSVYGFLLSFKNQPLNHPKDKLEEFCKFLDGKRSDLIQKIEIFRPQDDNERTYWKRALMVSSEN